MNFGVPLVWGAYEPERRKGAYVGALPWCSAGTKRGRAGQPLIATLTPVTLAAETVAPGVRVIEVPAMTPLMVPRFALAAPVRVTEIALVLQPASMPATVTVETL